MKKLKSKTAKRETINIRELESFHEQLKGVKGPGVTAASLKKRGFPAWATISAGFTIEELIEGGYSARSLKLAGIPQTEIDKFFKK